MMNRGIGTWVSRRAETSASKTAVVDRYRRLSYRQLEDETNRLASFLLESGIRKHDRVAALMMNRTEFLSVLFACAKIGAIFLPMNYRLNIDNLEFILSDGRPELLVYESAFESLVDGIRERMPQLKTLDVDNRSQNAYHYEIYKNYDPLHVFPEISEGDIVLLMYTSGTTGRPKGVLLTHGNVLWNAIDFITEWDIRDTDVTLVVNPIFHVVLNILTTPLIYKGGTVVLQDKFNPEEALEWMEREKVTCMFAIPTSWISIIQSPSFKTRDLSSLRFCSGGGAPVPMSVLRFFEEHHIVFREAFGLTETAPAVCTMPPADAIRKQGSIGKPFMHVEVKVVNESDKELPAHEIGELIARGPNIFVGYWNRPDATAEALRGGWFHTGDLARKDEEGYFYIVDRKKDLIISGGENIASVEVEQVLYTHPDVSEVAVIAYPDEKWGEVPMAVVVRKSGAQVSDHELIDYCRERLAHFKCPRKVEFVNELPKTATGKIQKNVLRDRYWQGRGKMVN